MWVGGVVDATAARDGGQASPFMLSLGWRPLVDHPRHARDARRRRLVLREVVVVDLEELGSDLLGVRLPRSSPLIQIAEGELELVGEGAIGAPPSRHLNSADAKDALGNRSVWLHGAEYPGAITPSSAPSGAARRRAGVG